MQETNITRRGGLVRTTIPQTKSKTKKVYFEIMRIFACMLVIYNHTLGYGMYGNTEGTEQVLYLLTSVITRVNVPIFLMISGALLLRKQDSIEKILKKRVSRIFAVMVLSEGLMYIIIKLFYLYNGVESEFSLNAFIHGFLDGSLEGCFAYWYLYAYISFLFLLPFLQRVMKGISGSEVLLLLVLHFAVYSVLPIINMFLGAKGIEPLVITGNFAIPFALVAAIFYPLMGYFLEYYIDIHKMNILHVVTLILVAIICIVITIKCVLYEGQYSGEFTQNYIYLFDYILAFVIFLLVKYLFVEVCPNFISDRLRSKIELLGSLTFGIYLADPFLKMICFYRLNLLLSKFCSQFVISVFWIIFSMSFCGFIVYWLKKISWINQLL